MEGQGQGCSGEAGNSCAAMDHAFCCPLIGLGDRPADGPASPSFRSLSSCIVAAEARERESWSSKAKLRQRRASDRHNGGGVGAVELWNKLDRLIEERDGNGRKT